MAALTSYSWPGNIRELQNLVQRAVILSDHGVLPNPLPTAMIRGLTAWERSGNIRELENFIEPAVCVTRSKSLEAPLEELGKTNTVADEYERRQRDEITRTLAACRGRVGGADGAAVRLGVNRTTLLWRMKKYGIYAKQYA
jgi:formate hydrogenlyase transcriptional activator